MHFITFTLDGQFFAIELIKVERIALSASLIPVPYTSKSIRGAINIHGTVIPVINLRSVLGFQEREMELSDQFLVCLMEDLKVALWVDSVHEIVDYQPKELLAPEKTLSFSYVKNVVNDAKHGTILICEWEKLIQLQSVK
jgi:purine-binding chemotaxis protein CheW